jgi:hypothetical protein
MYMTGSNNPSTDPTTWGACTLRASGDPFPVAGTGEFGFLQRVNGGVQVFNNGGNIAPGSWDTVGFATNTHWTVIFSDTTGTGSAFNGNGSQVTFVNGTNTLGTLTVGQLNTAGLRLGFRDTGNRFVGIDNLSISGTPAPFTPPGQNLSFEYDTTLSGQAIQFPPTSWTAFNQNAPSDFGSQHAGGTDYTVFDPLAAPADGSNFCYINVFSGNPTGGIYQDMGAMQPNTVYTLTVAIGNRNDTPPNGAATWSPGIISLVNGTDNTGTVLATGGGVPSSPNTWQDYTASFSTGPSVSGDVTVMLSVAGAASIQADFDNVRLSVVHSSIPLPVLITNTTPSSATVAVGSNVVFTAAFSNSPPVNLQWQDIEGGVTNNINTGVVTVTNNGIVSSTLTLNDVQVTNSGSYRLEAANATNFVTIVDSASAPLTVIPTITWYAAGTYNSSFSNNAVLALAGPVANEVYGVDFGGSGLLTTANGYTFNDVSAGNMTLSGTLNVFGGYLAGSATTGDGNFDIILNNGLNGSAANTGMLNNLTVGQTYTVMVLLDDTRSSPGGITFHITDGLTTSPDQRYAFVNGVPAVGGYIMGTFTAQATTQPLTILNNSGNSQYIAVLLMKGIAPPPPNPPTLVTDINPLLSEVSVGTPVTLSATVQGAVPLHYQWFNQSGLISGQTNTSYTFNAVAGTNSYYVSVTNTHGSIISSTAVVISATNIVNVNNFSFEAQILNPGQTIGEAAPTAWTGFNVGGGGALQNGWDWGISSPNGEFTGPPLTAPASGNNYLWVNRWNGNGTQVAGVYQDVGKLQPNTSYTLTVAIGNRNDTPPNGQPTWSPGIISLVNGTDNTGTVLATTTGLPITPNTWQDFTTNFTTGASVSGDLTILLSVQDGPAIQADFDNVRLTQTSVAPLMAPTFTTPHVSGGNMILTGTGGTPGSGYSILTTTNLSAPVIWTTNTTGILDGAGAFSNSVPLGVDPVRFFRVRVP